MISKIVIFLIINFAGLAIGSLYTNKGVVSEWYNQLNKAPWTPPGWFFGVAWMTIMICFAIYMAYAWEATNNHKLLINLFILQWILNAVWNPVFFTLHKTNIALLIIIALTTIIIDISYVLHDKMNFKSLLIAPYLVWLLIAISLNAYVVIKN